MKNLPLHRERSFASLTPGQRDNAKASEADDNSDAPSMRKPQTNRKRKNTTGKSCILPPLWGNASLHDLAVRVNRRRSPFGHRDQSGPQGAHGFLLRVIERPAGQIWKTYYFAGSQVVALRIEGDPIAANNGLFFLHSDHLGSASLTTDASGNPVARQLYDAWGNVRLRGDVKTDIGYTSQREEVGIHAMFYRARYYSPGIMRFISADTIVPDPTNPQTLNRYTYGLNNPIKYTDPSGHCSLNTQSQEVYDACIKRAQEIQDEYGIEIYQYETDDLWTLTSLHWLYQSLYLARALISKDTYTNYFTFPKPRFGTTSFYSEYERDEQYQTIWIDPEFFGNSRTFINNVLHELQHGLVASNDVIHGGSGKGEAFADWYAAWAGWKKDENGNWINPRTGPNPYARGEIPDTPVNPEEDSASTFAAVVMPCADNDRPVTPFRQMWFALWVSRLRSGP